MSHIRVLTILLIFFSNTLIFAQHQSIDSTQKPISISGSVGITNNGFAIIPTFSLNSPATVILLAFQKNKLSFEPDIRLVPNASKGGMVFWLRYKLIENKKFSLRLGSHPAFTYVKREISENGSKTEISELLRFAAYEIVPNYQLKPNWGVGAMFLRGIGLQTHGPQNTKVLFLNTSLTNLKLNENFRFNFIPVIYFLNTDGFKGKYFTATAVLANKNWPVTIQSSINKTLNSNIPGNKDFLWNVMLNYNFGKKYSVIK